MRRLIALIRKEMLQVMRDPSSLLIAGVMPLILLFIFGYGVNLDSNRIRIGLVLEDRTPETMSLASAFAHSRFLDVRMGRDRREFEELVVAGKLRGMVIIPQNFSTDAQTDEDLAKLQVIADGSEPNIASFVQNYSEGVVRIWMMQFQQEKQRDVVISPIQVQSRFWYNPELLSRNFLIPGSISIIMTLIGTMLTALVVAREWERGTMEALLATPVSVVQIILGKLIPYFLLGLGSMCLCWLVATLWYDVPFRGSFWVLILTTSVFLLGALGQGLMISTLAKDQFVASQMALMAAFLPAFMLSGFIFEISSMPLPVRLLTHVFAARYFVTSLQTLFLTGTIWPLLIRCMLAMLAIAAAFMLITAIKTSKRLDP